ncbi:hypothetical protein NFI96_012848 [Prochilodus magdalenae]|nr:hypothetical protein NFI96_012848 [Prochilodus magdalenae]
MWCPLLFGALLVLLTDLTAAHEKYRLTSCLPEDVLLKRVDKLLRRSVWKLERMPGEPAAASDDLSCSHFSRTQFTADIWNRSISPWRLITQDSDPDLYPQTYEEAKCLCSGCIIKGQESSDYNSKAVKRSVMFLRKVPCMAEPHKYSLVTEHKTISVACTCVMPRQ